MKASKHNQNTQINHRKSKTPRETTSWFTHGSLNQNSNIPKLHSLTNPPMSNINSSTFNESQRTKTPHNHITISKRLYTNS
jgi:hypothetical protein